MKKLLNTLFVVSPDTYLALENENVVIYRWKMKTSLFIGKKQFYAGFRF